MGENTKAEGGGIRGPGGGGGGGGGGWGSSEKNLPVHRTFLSPGFFSNVFPHPYHLEPSSIA